VQEREGELVGEVRRFEELADVFEIGYASKLDLIV